MEEGRERKAGLLPELSVEAQKPVLTRPVEMPALPVHAPARLLTDSSKPTQALFCAASLLLGKEQDA